MNQLQAVALNEGLRCKKRLWRVTPNNREPELAASTIRVVALLAASLADHRQARNAQIAGLLLAECRLRFSRLQFVGYEAADSYLMPEVPVNLNGAAA